MPLPEDFVLQLKQNNPIESVMASYVRLNRSSRDYVCLCPFHSEKSPSCHVNVAGQYFHCFGCGAGGDVITFIMKAENLEYIEAVRFLAERAGMSMPEDAKNNDFSRLKARILEINRMAARYFNHVLMKEPYGEKGRLYFNSRKLSVKTITKYGLGYAPDDWRRLTDHLKANGCREDEIVAANLARQSQKGGVYDSFRDRVMFPIVSTAKRVLGFGARTMGNDTPKYLNTGDTPIFNKRNNLYGLNLQRGKHLADIIIVEGYMDVISLYKAGVTNAVASLGTALTQQQARLIKRYVPKVYISYDGDSAGQNATLRGLDILAKEGLDVRVIVIPDNMDPDDYAKKFGGQEYLALKDKTLTLNGFKLDSLMGGIDLGTPDGREEYAKKACALLARLEPVEQERYAPVIARRTGLSKEAILRQCGISGSPAGNSIGNSRNTKQQNRERLKSLNKAETALLCCMIKSGEALLCAMEEMARYGISFSDSAINAFAEGLLARSVTGEKLDIPLALSMLPQEAAESVSAAIGNEDTVIDPVTTAKDCVAAIAREAMDERIKELAAAMQTGGSDEEKREYMELVKKRASLK